MSIPTSPSRVSFHSIKQSTSIWIDGLRCPSGSATSPGCTERLSEPGEEGVGRRQGTKPQEGHYKGKKGMRSGTKDTAEAVKWEVCGSIDDCDQAEIGSVWLWVWRWSRTFSGGKSLSISCLHTFDFAASMATGRSCWTGSSRHWNSSPPTVGTKLLYIVPDLFSNLALTIARSLCLHDSMSMFFFQSELI